MRRHGGRWIWTVLLAAGCAVSSGDDYPYGDARDEAADTDGGETTICATDHDCDDRIACTIDHCGGGECVHVPCTDCCREGLTCIAGRGCDRAPTPCTTDAECRDEVRCTLDRCRDATWCEHLRQDELCEPDEICLAGPGCVLRPPEYCSSDEECVIGPACVGEWECAPEFGCQFVGILDCDDGDACTTDTCDDAIGCVNTVRDEDGDRHAPPECGGDDCDDANELVHPGAEETCDGIDNDCDALTDEVCCEEGAPCPTDCGTTGTRTCNADGTPGPCTPPAESCNATDDDCDTETDEDFDCVLGSSTSCTTACGSGGTATCGTGCTYEACDPPAEVCNGLDDDCDTAPDQTFPCVLGAAESCTTSCSSAGTRPCLMGCVVDSVCRPPAESCNGADDDCDTAVDEVYACCSGCTRDCALLGFWAGTALCAADCSGWITTTCTNCGNLLIDGGEQCDGANLGGNDCTTIPGGYAGGTLRCTSSCTFDTSFCTRCGNGAIDAGEQCDGANLGGNDCTTIPGGYGGGTLRCTPSCTFDPSGCTSAWDPSGTYLITPPPTYRCAFWLVNFTISVMIFSDSGAVLVVTGAPCPMTGPSARSTRNINVTCTLSGSCDEIYSLTGSFDTDDHWTGTFTARFVGSCLDCVNRSWAVEGRR